MLARCLVLLSLFSLSEACVRQEPVVFPGYLKFEGIGQARWDGADGIVASWESASGAGGAVTYTLTVEDELGEAVSSIETSELTASATGLVDGAYVLWVEALSDDGLSSGSEVALTQWVGSERIVYRSEVPLFQAKDLWGEGDLIAITGGLNPDVSLQLVDTSDVLNPVVVSELKGIGYGREVKIVDDLLLFAVDPDSDGCEVCDGVGIRLYDISDPTDPLLLGEIGEPADAIHNMTYGAGHLYVSSMSEALLVIYDIGDPSNPQRVATWEPTGFFGGTHDQTWQDGVLYVAYTRGFAVLDVSNPADPVTMGVFTSDDEEAQLHNIWPSEDGLFAATSQERVNGHLEIWDLQDLDAIAKVGAFELNDQSSIHNVVLDGSVAYTSWYINGLMIFDLADPSTPELIDAYDTFDGDVGLAEDPITGALNPAIAGAFGVWPFGEHVAVSDTERGLVLFDFHPVVVTASP